MSFAAITITKTHSSSHDHPTAMIGFYFTNKNNSINAYMLGDRKLSVLPVALSLMTSCLSGLTFLGTSAELYYQGPTYAFVAIAIFLSGPITAYTVLPVFYHMNELSLYKVSTTMMISGEKNSLALGIIPSGENAFCDIESY